MELNQWVDELFEVFDEDKDGVINRSEFVELIDCLLIKAFVCVKPYSTALIKITITRFLKMSYGKWLLTSHCNCTYLRLYTPLIYISANFSKHIIQEDLAL